MASAFWALGTLLLYVIRSWGAASALDRLLQLSLVISAAVGLYLFLVGLQSLGVHPHLPLRRAPRSGRATAATQS